MLTGDRLIKSGRRPGDLATLETDLKIRLSVQGGILGTAFLLKHALRHNRLLNAHPCIDISEESLTAISVSRAFTSIQPSGHNSFISSFRSSVIRDFL